MGSLFFINYIQNNGIITIMKRSLDKDGKEVNEEVAMDKVPILQRELFRAEYTYGAQMNGPKQINGVALIEVNGKQYALDRKNQKFLTEEQTKDFIEQLNKKNNPQPPKQPQPPQPPQQSKQVLDITIITNKNGQKEAQVKIPKELLGMAKPMGKIKVNDILYPVIIVERPNNGKSSYSVLLPNGQETNFGVNSFNNAEPNLGLKILEFLFSPDNMPELQQAFETAVNSLNQQGTSQDQNGEDNIGQTSQQPVTAQESQIISNDDLLDIMNVSVTNIPMPNQQPPQQAQVQNQSNVTVDDDSQNIDLSYDANIELLRLLAVSRETWNSMDSETKKSMLGCQ